MKTLTYRKNEKKEKKKNWDSFKKQLKDEFIKTKENVKETIEDIKKQFNEDNKTPQNTSRRNTNYKNKIRKNPIDSNLELFCPFCEYPIPKELKPIIKDSDSIVCENCGTEIKKSSFFKKYSFPD